MTSHCLGEERTNVCVAVSCPSHLSHDPRSQHNQSTQRMEVQDDERAGTVQHNTPHTPYTQAPPTALLYTHTYPSHFLCTQYPLPFPYTLHIQCPPAICMGRHTMNQSSSAVSTITHLGVMVPVLPHKLEGYSRSWTAAVQVPTGHWR